jgi:hypothetical protein
VLATAGYCPSAVVNAAEGGMSGASALDRAVYPPNIIDSCAGSSGLIHILRLNFNEFNAIAINPALVRRSKPTFRAARSSNPPFVTAATFDGDGVEAATPGDAFGITAYLAIVGTLR